MGNLGANGPVTPEQLKDTLQASCSADGVAGSNCDDVLLMVLTPPAYSSNSTEDTGGNAFISPAQVGATPEAGARKDCFDMACTARTCSSLCVSQIYVVMQHSNHMHMVARLLQACCHEHLQMRPVLW